MHLWGNKHRDENYEPQRREEHREKIIINPLRSVKRINISLHPLFNSTQNKRKDHKELLSSFVVFVSLYFKIFFPSILQNLHVRNF